jgi:hypothetical protein
MPSTKTNGWRLFVLEKELVINTPPPALANAVFNGTGVNIRTLPITSEKIAMGML